MVNTQVTLCGLTLDNPIIPASGTFGYGYEFAELYDINLLGTFSFKGTTRESRFGNPTPRIAEYAGGLLNAVGLQNPGVDAVIAEELPRLKKVFHKPVMANISGFSVQEYAEVCEKLANGVSLINTLPGMRIDLKRRRPLLANGTGGMSGPGMFPLAVRMVYQVYEAVSIPIVGMGGVTTAEDVIELMLAGATAVGVGAANLTEPFACKHIVEELPAAMARYGVENLTEIIGGAHHG